LTQFKLDLLRKYWDKELHVLIGQYAKKRTKSKKNKDMLNKLRTIKDEVKEAVLRKYLEKCRTAHSLKFFEWRRQLSNLHLDVSWLRVTIICRGDTNWLLL